MGGGLWMVTDGSGTVPVDGGMMDEDDGGRIKTRIGERLGAAMRVEGEV